MIRLFIIFCYIIIYIFTFENPSSTIRVIEKEIKGYYVTPYNPNIGI